MLARARVDCPQAEFRQADLASWMPGTVPDLLYSNATFQWVPDHMQVLSRLTGRLQPGGVLAVQMPDNLAEPSHRLMQEVAEAGPWAAKLGKASAARSILPAPTAYYALLKPLFQRLDIWHTSYNHPLDGAPGILDWLMTTGLRPYLAPLDSEEQAAYLAIYEARVAKAYVAMPDGKVLLRLPRLFMVGVR